MREGWKCPVCGRGNSPDVKVCRCHGDLPHDWRKKPEPDTSIYVLPPNYPPPTIRFGGGEVSGVQHFPEVRTL